MMYNKKFEQGVVACTIQPQQPFHPARELLSGLVVMLGEVRHYGQKNTAKFL